MIIPTDRLYEEADIIARLRRGERLKHFETVRRRKDGTLVPISATISPVRNRAGAVIGASKIARDITQQIAAAEEQKLLLAEMRHRVGNAFAVAGRLIAVPGRGGGRGAGPGGGVGGRARARAHGGLRTAGFYPARLRLAPV